MHAASAEHGTSGDQITAPMGRPAWGEEWLVAPRNVAFCWEMAIVTASNPPVFVPVRYIAVAKAPLQTPVTFAAPPPPPKKRKSQGDASGPPEKNARTEEAGPHPVRPDDVD